MNIQRIIKIEGKVKHGNKDGSKIGFPTANIAFDKNLKLDYGVYASKIKIGDSVYDSITHFGPRLAFNENFPRCEVHIFDYNNEIYGRNVEVYLFEKIRKTEDFDSIEKLIEQIDKDCEKAKKLLDEKKGIDPEAAYTKTGN